VASSTTKKTFALLSDKKDRVWLTKQGRKRKKFVIDHVCRVTAWLPEGWSQQRHQEIQ